MKKIILTMGLCVLSLVAFAQEEKPETDQTASPEISALQTAMSLAKYGYDNYSATALAEAAKIFADTQTQPLEETPKVENATTVDEKDNPVNYEVEQLLADAKKYADNDEVTLSFIAQVENGLKEKSTRGAVGGPKIGSGRVYAHSNTTYTIRFWGGEVACVAVSGDGDTDLDLYVYDSSGRLVAKDDDYTDDCLVMWVVPYTENYTIKIVNRGNVYNEYGLATN